MNLVLCLYSLAFFFPEADQTHSNVFDNFEFPKDRASQPPGRIIGGKEVAPHSYPFLAGLFMYYEKSSLRSFCGGTLISPKWVLTAAHCVYDQPSYAEVVLGAHDVTANEPTQVVLKSTTYVVHEKWDKTLLQNDIALVKLPRTVTLNEFVNTVVYTKTSQNYDELTGTVVGWGKTDNSETLSVGLRKVDSLILTNEQCMAIDPFQEVIIPSHVCLDGTGPVGSCEGDSGGPLLVGKLQVGIVSFGYKTCKTGKPSVFSRITDFKDWIEEHTSKGENTACNLAVITALLLIHLRNYS